MQDNQQSLGGFYSRLEYSDDRAHHSKVGNFCFLFYFIKGLIKTADVISRCGEVLEKYNLLKCLVDSRIDPLWQEVKNFVDESIELDLSVLSLLCLIGYMVFDSI